MIRAVVARGSVMLWALIVVALVGFLLAFVAHSPGWLGFGLAVGLLSAIAAALAFIERHIRASARPEHMTDRELDALRASMRQSSADSNRNLPPPGAS
jgi:hypothetical protein